MNYHNTDMMQQIQQLYWYLNAQQEKISQLEAKIQHLEKDLNTLRENETSKIERIEYKFDQLKVERLEGTLNIGITPNNDGSSIEDFSVNQHGLNVPPPQQDSELFGQIREHIHQYLNGDLQDFVSIENQNNYPVDHHYRQHIIEDIRKQIDNRIDYYLNQVDVNNLNQADLRRIHEMTINKVKEDIRNTYEGFIRHLPRKENE